ncbi:hypothetical protein VB834_03365 [Limnoraphis robusta Tam1]|uniref:hypothetical protein n=1 Tax=Limnoraphis robusta TaxID=1118279 RepID=UPI002B208F44|nr:hypothetical protein [Limnoraphis robusta]MEA5497716.1 hypothetical protein [Limnoraphis robusta BA-68 BA1]MEA5538066.1 hypothetical protein [Limnoraphis robusta Tam1]
MKKKFLLLLVLFFVLTSSFLSFPGKAFAWTVNKKNAEFGQLTKAEQAKFDIFQDEIHNHGLHPKDAAKEAGDTDYKQLKGNQFQIRLSGRERATFLVDDENEIVTILQVGGHT